MFCSDSYFKCCDGRCGEPNIHFTHDCKYKNAWEITDVTDLFTLTWIYKVCGQCASNQIHYLDGDCITVGCTFCNRVEIWFPYKYLHKYAAKKIATYLHQNARRDSSHKSRIVNVLGDQLIEDMIIESPIPTKDKDFIQSIIHKNLKNPWFEGCNNEEHVYKLQKNTIFLIASMFKVLYNVPESLETSLEEENRLGMDLEDRRANIRFTGDPEYRQATALFNIHNLNDGSCNYFWNGARAYIEGQWMPLTPDFRHPPSRKRK